MGARCAVVGVLVLAVGCATPYQKRGFLGGYDDFRITQDVFEVSFTGNGHTPREKVSRYVLRRASEVALTHGFTHFAPERELDHTVVGAVYSSSGHSTAHAYGTGRGAYSYGHGSSSGYATPVVKPALTMRIRCFKTPAAAVEGLIDARDFLEYNFPEALAELEAVRPSEGGGARLRAGQ